MIDFPCRCGHVFHVDEKLAGEPLQCPDCRKLVYVPTTSDLAEWETDGTYRTETPPPKPDPKKLDELYQAFTHREFDDAGRPIDNRLSLYDPAAPPVNDDPERIAPRYDPETGERIRELDIRPDEAPPLDADHAVPVISASLNYASRAPGSAAEISSPWRVLLELFMPANAACMFFVFVFHLVFALASVLQVIAIVLGVMLFLGLIAHWMNVIEDTGPLDRDEVPRLFRFFTLGEDIFTPGWHGIFALAVCFGPASSLFAHAGDATPKLAAALAAGALGVVCFPAVAITLAGGDLVDLRPDRLFGTIGACGRSYVLLVIIFILASSTYAVGLLVTPFAGIVLRFLPLGPLVHYQSLIGYPMLAIGIYFMHWFCWSAGLVYRAHHGDFPWTWQRHFRTDAIETVKSARTAGAAALLSRAPRRETVRPVLTKPLPVQELPVRGFPVQALPVDPLPVNPQPKAIHPAPQMPKRVEPLDPNMPEPHDDLPPKSW